MLMMIFNPSMMLIKKPQTPSKRMQIKLKTVTWINGKQSCYGKQPSIRLMSKIRARLKRTMKKIQIN